MKTIKTLAAALMLSLFCGFGVARSQTKTASQLDETGLKTVLENLGHEVTPAPLSGNRTGYWINVIFQGQKAQMFVQISPSGGNIWGTLNLAELKPEHHQEGARLIRLLQLNQKHGPCHFYVHPNGKTICLTKALTNNALASRDIREHIEMLLDVATQTIADWDTAKWGPPSVATKAPVVPQ